MSHELTQGRMRAAFFTNSGSEAIDTVIKMVWYYNNALGRSQKKKIIARNRGYHGVTVASASLTGLAPNHRGFDLPLPQVKHVTCPQFLSRRQRRRNTRGLRDPHGQ
jgi:4-aminobutyrate--pyruvate transaminase